MSTIQILLHGLIALVPLNDSTGAANHMWALLVDARNPPAQECLVPHQALLTIRVKDVSECTDGCEINAEGDCVCILEKDEISLVIQPPLPELQRQKLGQTPEKNLPADASMATSFSYVANLADPRLGSHVLDPDLIATPLPYSHRQPLVARMKFPFTSVTACALGVRHERGISNVHSMSFHKIYDDDKTTDTDQAVAQSLLAQLAIPSDRTVSIQITRLDQSSSRTIQLASGEHGFEIELSNMRELELGTGDPCDDGIGRDFALFYNLVLHPPKVWRDRILPQILHTRSKSEAGLTPSECPGHGSEENKSHKNPNSRPICPMASFNSGGGR
jgi:hypothetical protein